MGSSLSGRHSDKPLAEDCLAIDIARIMRLGRTKGGAEASGKISWPEGEQSASVKFWLDLRKTETACLVLDFTLTVDAQRHPVRQKITLTSTAQNFGGRRWWLRCPVAGARVRKLYLPIGADRFASREAWNLGYRVERLCHFDRPFEKLFRAQRKLGGAQGLTSRLKRPKGMWRRTYFRHLDDCVSLDGECLNAIVGLIE